MTIGADGWARGGLAVRIFLFMASGYFMSYGLRAINATIAPELVAETGLDNARLGALTSAYFVGFALMQLPVGIWLDRFGPRRVNATLMLVAALGCLLFGLASSFATLWFARMLLGVGMSAGLMACFASSRLWFAPGLQTRMAAWTVMMGTMGVLVATIPVRHALAWTDWRGVFFICAALLVAISAVMAFGVPRGRGESGSAATAGASSPAGGQSFLALLAGYREVGHSSYFWRMAIVGALNQGSFIALQTLWVGPWFNRVLGFSPEVTAAALFAFNATLLGGYLVTGWLAPRVLSVPARILRVAAIGVANSMVMLALTAAAPVFSGVITWIIIALISCVFTPIQASVGMQFPARLGGRALTAYNLIVFVAVFIIQAGLGFVVDALIGQGLGEPDAFRVGLAVVAALQVVALLTLMVGRGGVLHRPRQDTP